MKLAARACAVMMLVCLSGGAMAQDAKKAIEYRQSVFKVIVWDFGVMGAMVKGEKDFDAKDFARRAERVADMAPRIAEGFPAGSDMADIETRAKPEIWSDAAGFKQAWQRLVDETEKLAMVAKSGDEAAMKKQFAATGKACKGCHDDYRKPKS
ncbi:MAG: cytochrome c [Gammaproteobacteria bacterium]|nr:cytochrome c [Gammaproteobacteria bacterium]